MTTGLILGKFMPPHRGHLHLFDFAQHYADDVTIVVGTLPDEPIDPRRRYDWVRELAPRAHVVHLSDPLPQDPAETPRFWRIWEDALRSRLDAQRFDYVFASESYGRQLAQIFDAEFVPVDPQRRACPVSGTAVRRNPRQHFADLPPCVRAYYTRRICIFGPESTGKTTLATRLAATFDAPWVPEYARTLIEERGRTLEAADMARIARGQAAAENALARQSKGLLFCDTDLLSTQIWSQCLFKEVPASLHADTPPPYDLYLLCDVDVPWVADETRYFSEERKAMHARFREALTARGRPFVEIAGDWEQRFQTAKAAVEALAR